MAGAKNISAIFEALSVIPKLHSAEKIHKRSAAIVSLISGKKNDEIQDNNNPLQTTRRLAAIGIASLAINGNQGTGISLAEDNGYWLTSPMPIPSVKNRKPHRVIQYAN